MFFRGGPAVRLVSWPLFKCRKSRDLDDDSDKKDVPVEIVDDE